MLLSIFTLGESLLVAVYAVTSEPLLVATAAVFTTAIVATITVYAY